VTRTFRAIVGAPFAKRSWLATMQLTTGLAVSVITLSVMLFLTLVGVAVLPTVVLTAVPFVALLACADVFTAWQRSRLAAFDGVRIPEAPGVLPRGGAGSLTSDLLKAARRLSTWRQIGYHLIVGPAIASTGAAAAAACWSAALVFATHPVQAALFANEIGPRSHPKLVAATVTGVLLFFVAPWVARGAARIDTAAATMMLGPDRAAELERLAESRAATISAADTERRRIERDLHDGAQQQLVSMAMRLGLARATLEDVPPEAMRVIERAHEDVKEAIKELRDLVQGMHPAILNDRGLDAALSGIAARAPLPVKLTSCRRRLRPSRSSSSPRRSPTLPSTPPRPTSRSASGTRIGCCSSPSRTTAAAAPTRITAAGCAGSGSGPRQWTGHCISTAHRGDPQ